jgi:hypothetical protein
MNKADFLETLVKVATRNENFLNWSALQTLSSPKGNWRYEQDVPQVLDSLDKLRGSKASMNKRIPPNPEMVSRYVKKTPRFLFRSWKTRSGGPKDLNSEQQFCPAFFHYPEIIDKPNYPPSYTDFFKIPQTQLQLRAKLHLRGEKGFDTYYSSWTQSLIWAISLHQGDTNGVHISVLDTASPSFRKAESPILSATNLGKVVGFSTATFRQYAFMAPPGEFVNELRARFMPGYEHELLAFGPIYAPAYSTVSWSKLQHAGIDELFVPGDYNGLVMSNQEYQVQTDISAELPFAKACGRLFGPGFDVPVMAHIMGHFHENNGDHERIVAALSTEDISEGLRGLPDVNPADIDYEGHTEALRGDQILRDVVIGKFGGYTASTVEERIRAENERQKSKEKAYSSAKHDTRASQGAIGMFMHMTGVPQKAKGKNTKEESSGKESGAEKSVEKKIDGTSKEE